ncbi:hypothetical protein LCGC14_0245770 [marine sediment metagenome]|uniref:Uncharacterized protein n=1 Tax=marine sediment metagenome TaxID=412755 RepID=A0A0F9WR23_9ZZZZ
MKKGTYKSQVIKALKKLIEQYRNHAYVPGREVCPLCNIFSKIRRANLYASECNGCPMAPLYAGIIQQKGGCSSFHSYQNVTHMHRFDDTPSSRRTLIKAQDKRADFHEELLKLVRTLPTSQFNPKTWKYLDLRYIEDKIQALNKD